MFIAGGDSSNGEHQSFDTYYQTWIDSLPYDLAGSPTNIQDTIVDRTDFSGGVDASHIGQLENLLLDGQSIMYFGGHGATFTSDVAFPDASVLQNKGLYPLLITLTCHVTGARRNPINRS